MTSIYKGSTSANRRISGRGLLLMTASSALALVCATPAFAQDADEAAAASDEVIVTGIRGSLQRNLDIKRESSGVVDVISAEDIGKFPDSNVASALQRLPGVAIQRSGARGDATGVSIRGFGGDFVRTLYDGRQLSTATGGRGIDFTTVGADFVGRLSVYKTPDVELSSAAIGGTIDISLPKPFDREGFVLAASGSGSIQSRDKKVRPTGGLLVSNTFGDVFGVLGSVAYTRRDTESNQVFIPGWIGQSGGGVLGVYRCQLTASCTAADLSTNANRTGTAAWAPQQQGINQQSTQDERIDGRIALQFRPTDNLLLTIDDNFSRQTVRSQTYGYAAWFNGSDLRNVKLDSNGTVVDFNQFGTPMDFNANRSSNVYESNQVGANLKWEFQENWTFEADAAIARATRNPGKGGYNDSGDIGYGGVNGQNGRIETGSTVLGANTGVTILGPSSEFLPQIHDIGPAGNASRFLDTSVVGSHVIVRGTNYNYNNTRQFRASLGWEDNGFAAKFGAQYIDDTLYQQSDSTFTNGVFASRSGYGTCSGRPAGTTGGICPLPANVYEGTVSTDGFIPGYEGNLAPGFFRYSPYAVYALLEQTGGSVAPSFNPGSVLEVREKTWSGWFKLKGEMELGSMPLKVAAGVRYENTKVTTSAIGRRVLGLSIPAGDPTLIQPNPALGPNRDGYSESTTIERESDYWYVLPSVDLRLELTPSLTFRADVSRTLTRPGLGNLRPTVNLGTLRVGSLSASGGNPDLKPYLADNFDAGLEWYYQRNSYFAVNAYLKNISNFIVGGVTRGPIDGVIDPSTGATAIFNINAQVNGPTATVKGVELALQHVFGDSGFGFSANATLPSTNRKYDPSNVTGGAFSITGLAKSANFVGFYDKNGFQIRGAVNWRDEYLLGLGQGQGGTYGAEPVYVDRQLQIDASASYDITRQFTVFGEVTNINNSTYSTHGRFDNQALDIWSYGRRFTAGARFRY